MATGNPERNFRVGMLTVQLLAHVSKGTGAGRIGVYEKRESKDDL